MLIAVRASLNCRSVVLQNCGNLEQAVVHVKLQNFSIYVCGIYLRPNSQPELYYSHFTAVQQLCNRFSDSDKVIFLGDYNLPRLSWQIEEDVDGLLPSNASSEQEIALVETMVASGLYQINNLQNSSENILDLTFVNETRDVELIEPPSSLLRIDNHHRTFVLRVDLNNTRMCSNEDSIPIDDFDFRSCNFDELNRAISSVDWIEQFRGKDTDDTVCTFYDVLYAILDEHVPRRRRRHHPFKHPWWTAELQHLRNVVRKSRKRYFRARTVENRNNLSIIEARYEECQTAAFRSYVARVESSAKQNPSTFWSFIRNRKQSPRLPAEMTFKEVSANSPIDVANLFADFFESVHNSSFPTFSPANLRNCPTFDLNLLPFDIAQHDVTSALENLDVNKGPGTDNLPPLFLRECAESLQAPLTIIFNKSLRTSTFPELWKTASVTPISKAGASHTVENYRGVSILCCLAKVFEGLVHNILYAASEPLISEFQHGFVKKRSTTTNLMAFTSFLSSELEKRCQVDAIYFDFSKAFDKVPHDLAIAKLKHLGFPSWIAEWLRSYLTQRKAFVNINGTHSRTYSIASGVPQGSVLGPLIFILFINDLCYRLKSQKLLYADDLKIYRIVTSMLDCCALQDDVNELNLWCTENGMELNVKKCKSVVFSRRQSRIGFDYFVGSELLERVDSIRDLGVIIDNKLRFDEHICVTTAKAFAALGFVRRNTRFFKDIYALKSLYCALVRSILEYAVCVWSPHHATQIIRIERVQRSFIRYALRLLPWSNPANLPEYAARCRLIALETLASRRDNLRRLFIYDLLIGNLDCSSLLQNISFYAPQRQLRERSLIFVPRHRTAYGFNNALSTCFRLFNSVSDLFDFNVSKNVFKNRIKILA